MIQHRILFVCVHNSARSQMAEAFLNHFDGECLVAESAGFDKGTLNQYAVKVMQEVGIDISHKGTQEVFDLFKQGRLFQGVITVCDEGSAKGCPIFPGSAKRIGWSFSDPSTFDGTEEEILERTRKVRDEIKAAVLAFIDLAKHMEYWADEKTTP